MLSVRSDGGLEVVAEALEAASSAIGIRGRGEGDLGGERLAPLGDPRGVLEVAVDVRRDQLLLARRPQPGDERLEVAVGHARVEDLLPRLVLGRARPAGSPARPAPTGDRSTSGRRRPRRRPGRVGLAEQSTRRRTTIQRVSRSTARPGRASPDVEPAAQQGRVVGGHAPRRRIAARPAVGVAGLERRRADARRSPARRRGGPRAPSTAGAPARVSRRSTPSKTTGSVSAARCRSHEPPGSRRPASAPERTRVDAFVQVTARSSGSGSDDRPSTAACHDRSSRQDGGVRLVARRWGSRPRRRSRRARPARARGRPAGCRRCAVPFSAGDAEPVRS